MSIVQDVERWTIGPGPILVWDSPLSSNCHEANPGKFYPSTHIQAYSTWSTDNPSRSVEFENLHAGEIV